MKMSDKGAPRGSEARGRRSAGSPGNRGFSMIEMLVVIAIISILVVLLLAALRGVRTTARLSQCMSNVKNLGIGVHSFKQTRKGYGLPGAPNAFCNSAGGGTGDQFKAGQQSGKAPNTLWTSTPQSGNLKQRVGFIPFAAGPSRFSNHGFLYKGQHVNDERVYSCPDMEGLYTPESDDINSFDRTLKTYLPDPTSSNRWDPPTALTPTPAGELAWMSSYDYRSCFDPGAAIYTPLGKNWGVGSGGTGERAIPDYRGPYDPINFGQQAAETAIFADTLQNPGNQKIAHENRRYNVVFADGHGAVLNDDLRVATYNKMSPSTGENARTIAELNLAIATTTDYWYWNERMWNEVLSKP